MDHKQEELLKNAIEKGCEVLNANPEEVFGLLKHLASKQCQPVPGKHLKGSIRRSRIQYVLRIEQSEWDGTRVIVADDELPAWFHPEEVARIRELKTGKEIKVLFFAQLKRKKA